MEDVKPRSAQWSRLVICKSKFQLGVEWACGHFLGLNSKALATSILCWAHSTKGHFNPFFIVPVHILI